MAQTRDTWESNNWTTNGWSQWIADPSTTSIEAKVGTYSLLCIRDKGCYNTTISPPDDSIWDTWERKAVASTVSMYNYYLLHNDTSGNRIGGIEHMYATSGGWLGNKLYAFENGNRTLLYDSASADTWCWWKIIYHRTEGEGEVDYYIYDDTLSEIASATGLATYDADANEVGDKIICGNQGTNAQNVYFDETTYVPGTWAAPTTTTTSTSTSTSTSTTTTLPPEFLDPNSDDDPNQWTAVTG